MELNCFHYFFKINYLKHTKILKKDHQNKAKESIQKERLEQRIMKWQPNIGERDQQSKILVF